MRGLLDEICQAKRQYVAARKKEVPLAALEEAAGSLSKPRGFIQSLRAARTTGQIGLICEIKRASPSAGSLRQGLDVARIARAYERGGARCLSVLTDRPYFKGHERDLAIARAATDLPVLRKDFILDPYQIAESRAIGADCILLILAALDSQLAADLEAAALDLGLDVLIEVHNEKELERSFSMQSPLLGINNRNLATLEVDLETSKRLSALTPGDRLIVSESGLRDRRDLKALEIYGIRCFLIGESLLRQHDVETATKALLKDGAHGKTQPPG